MLKRPRLQRIIIASTHGHFRDTLRKSIQLVYRRANKYRLKFPFMVALEVTTDCTLDCIMCPRYGRNIDPGFMSLDLFQKIIDECAENK